MKCLLVILLAAVLSYSNCLAQEWSTPEAMRAFGKPGDTVNPDLLKQRRKYGQDDEPQKPALGKKKKKELNKDENVESSYLQERNSNASSNTLTGYQPANKCSTYVSDVNRVSDSSSLGACYKAKVLNKIINEEKCDDENIVNNAIDNFSIAKIKCDQIQAREEKRRKLRRQHTQ